MSGTFSSDRKIPPHTYGRTMSNRIRDFEVPRHSLVFHYRYVDRGPGPLFVSFPSARTLGSITMIFMQSRSRRDTLERNSE